MKGRIIEKIFYFCFPATHAHVSGMDDRIALASVKRAVPAVCVGNNRELHASFKEIDDAFLWHPVLFLGINYVSPYDPV
jgi:hypothetical protein